MANVEMIKKELKKRIENANFKPLTITMKCNGDTIVITPCQGYADECNWDTVEYFLVDSQYLPWLGADALEKVADEIARYEELLKENFEDIEYLKAHIRKYGEESDWGFVSDYHKDLFGHRPHVPHSQLFAWANSKSTDSARFF